MSRVEGADDVIAYLNRKLKEIEGPMTNKFVTEVLISTAAHTAFYTPVDTSFLINSQFRRVYPRQNGYAGELGWGAEYAAAVNYGPDRNWKKSGASNMFLEKGVEDMVRSDLDQIIKRSYKV